MADVPCLMWDFTRGQSSLRERSNLLVFVCNANLGNWDSFGGVSLLAGSRCFSAKVLTTTPQVISDQAFTGWWAVPALPIADDVEARRELSLRSIA